MDSTTSAEQSKPGSGTQSRRSWNSPTRPPPSTRSTPRPTSTSGSWNCGRASTSDAMHSTADCATSRSPRGKRRSCSPAKAAWASRPLLARFVRDFRREHPDWFVLAHFVGASPRTTSLPTMLRRLTQELQRRYALTLPDADSPDEIIRTFQVAITSLPESARVVLVFDALNQLDADDRAETLIWLPELLPANVRVLASVATGPQRAPRVLSAFGERNVVVVPMEPLTRDERRDIVKAVPKLVAKTLDDRQIDALLANPATENPLFLMIALEELRGYGSFENLNTLIARLPRTGDALTTLFEQVFERLEKEFGANLVAEVLSLLACARRGLSGPELVELTRHLKEAADDLYPLLRSSKPTCTAAMAATISTT